VNGRTNPLIWGSGPLTQRLTAQQRVRYAYLRQKETERAAAALLLYPDWLKRDIWYLPVDTGCAFRFP
jgi:hypothetical protein